MNRLVCLPLALAVSFSACTRGTNNPPPAEDAGSRPGSAVSEPDAGSTGTPDAGLPPLGGTLPPNAISKENEQAGDPQWTPTKVAHFGEIEGYTSASSVAVGEPVDVFVSANAASQVRYRLERLGWYGGAGARLISQGGPFSVGNQGTCPTSATGMTACTWPKTFSIDTAHLLRGVYVIRLDRTDGPQRMLAFVVRDPVAEPLVLATLPTATWQAYNAWGGESLYDDQQHRMPSQRAWQVSYDRPYIRDAGAGDLLTHDIAMVRWLEAQGLDVGYFTSEDMDAEAVPASVRAILLSGHDEYWSSNIRDHVEQAVDRGVSLLSLGANEAYWQVRFGPSPDGRPRRVITCYKTDAPAHDPVGPNSPLLTVRFKDPQVNRPESTLLGIAFTQHWNQFAFPAQIADGSHWALADTGLSAGDTLWRGAGYEEDELTTGSPPDVEILARSASMSLQSEPAFTHMALHRRGNAWIFAAGGIDFVGLLGATDQADPRAQRLVANILYRALGVARPKLVEIQGKVPASQGPFASQVRTIAGVVGQHGMVDGPRQTARLNLPTGLAVLPGNALAVLDGQAVRRIAADGSIQTIATLPLGGPAGLAADGGGTIYVSDAAFHTIWSVSPSGVTRVIAGANMDSGATNGAGAVARFSNPQGLAMAHDGNLLVADLSNGLIRKIDLHSGSFSVSTVATGLARPSGVAEASDGSLMVVETGAVRITQVRSGALHPLAGMQMVGFADGPAASALILPFLGIAVLSDGSVMFSDPGNARVRRLKNDTVTTWVGSGHGGTNEGRGDQTDVSVPAGMAVGPDGTLYVAEAGNGVVRAITP